MTLRGGRWGGGGVDGSLTGTRVVAVACKAATSSEALFTNNPVSYNVWQVNHGYRDVERFLPYSGYVPSLDTKRSLRIVEMVSARLAERCEGQGGSRRLLTAAGVSQLAVNEFPDEILARNFSTIND